MHTLKCQIDILLLLCYQMLTHACDLLYFTHFTKQMKINLIDFYITYECLSEQYRNKPVLVMHGSTFHFKKKYVCHIFFINPFFSMHVFIHTQFYINWNLIEQAKVYVIKGWLNNFEIKMFCRCTCFFTYSFQVCSYFS